MSKIGTKGENHFYTIALRMLHSIPLHLALSPTHLQTPINRPLVFVLEERIRREHPALKQAKIQVRATIFHRAAL